MKNIMLYMLLLISFIGNSQTHWNFKSGITWEDEYTNTATLNIQPSFNLGTMHPSYVPGVCQIDTSIVDSSYYFNCIDHYTQGLESFEFGIFTIRFALRYLDVDVGIVDQSVLVASSNYSSLNDIWPVYSTPPFFDNGYVYTNVIMSGTFELSGIEFEADSIYHLIRLQFYNLSNSSTFIELLDDDYQLDNNSEWWCSNIKNPYNFHGWGALPQGGYDAVHLPTTNPHNYDRFIQGQDSLLVYSYSTTISDPITSKSSITPNISTGLIYANIDKSSNIIILGIDGKIVYDDYINAHEQKIINLENVSTGIYKAVFTNSDENYSICTFTIIK